MQVEGTIPKELSGTLLRNGPGLFEIGDKKIAQPFDGDGLVRWRSPKHAYRWNSSKPVTAVSQCTSCGQCLPQMLW